MRFTEARLDFTNVTLEHVVRAFDTAGIQLKTGSTITLHSDHWSRLVCVVSSVDDRLYLFDCHWTYGINEKPGGAFEHAVQRAEQEAPLTLTEVAS